MKSKSVGEEIKRLRESAGLTQHGLAQELGLSVQFVSQLEQGRRGLSEETIKKIEQYFNVTTLTKLHLRSRQGITSLFKQCSQRRLDAVFKVMKMKSNELKEFLGES